MDREMDREMLKGLAVLLIVASIWTLLLSMPFNRQGFWLNVSTELIGVVVSVGIIGWIFATRDKARWQSVQQLTDGRLRMIAHEVFTLLAIWPPIIEVVLDQIPVGMLDEPMDVTTLTVLRAAQGVPVGELDNAILNFQEATELASLQRNLQRFDDRMMKTFDRFERRLSPEQMTLIVNISNELIMLDNLLAFKITHPGVNIEAGQRIKSVFSNAHDLAISAHAS